MKKLVYFAILAIASVAFAYSFLHIVKFGFGIMGAFGVLAATGLSTGIFLAFATFLWRKATARERVPGGLLPR
jgi:hypothetical protein